MLDEVLLDYTDQIGEENWIFQQDNAPIHVSKLSKSWFTSKNIEILEWPAISPDLNPIENLWGIMSTRVYANGRQFGTVEELKNCIREVWKNFTVTELQNLILSMPNRIFEVIKNNL